MITKFEIYNEAIIINKEQEKPKNIPKEYFSDQEIKALSYNEGFPFTHISKQKAVSNTKKFKISIYKVKEGFYIYRIRNMEKINNPIIYDEVANNVNDCLNDLDNFLWEQDKKAKEEDAKKKKPTYEEDETTKPKKDPSVFSGYPFSGKGKLIEKKNYKL
jgi:hypothetical protein